MEFTATTPERMTGTIVMRSQGPSGERTTKIESASRWLGADCGEVKPATPPKPE